ncbi:potassium transporter [Rhizobium laguerreae]|uniref:monovalent cation:proton antiporter-2 (CPA2) family protein n=1 Tax=Rhizobium laguerreae TaxID=1076926 RepID=UPI001C8FE64F|nr:monovalent cation:proton antiporter-2 (CPA2) family protein [Rhizobium laguerreae]MBY3417093.1 potassium transporter [Rhizobium laguerreae]
MNGFLFQAFIYLLAAVVAVLIAKRLGLGSVLGYLIAGVVIGPLLHLVGNETEDLQTFAEFGVVMMLFLVGLELQPRTLWDMRTRLLGLGGLQVLVTGGVLTLLGIVVGVPWDVSMVAGFVLSMSSTAIVLQTLGEKGLLKSDGGQSCFSVLLFQDISVIPILAVIPLLARPELIASQTASHSGGHASQAADWMSGMPGWEVTLITVAAVGFVVVAGNYLSRPFFRIIAASKLREVFTAAGLLLVIAIALLMTLVGLSPALGTFLAGVVLANSEFRHELESDIEPFKGLLLGLFFITVGASVNFTLLWDQLPLVAALTAAVMATKAAVLYGLGRMFKLQGADRWLFALGVAQAGEFGFVLLSFTVQSAVLAESIAAILLLVIALSMMLTPVLFILLDKLIIPRLNRVESKQSDEIGEQAHIIIAGLGRFGQVINRILVANGHKTVVLDYRADIVDGLRKMGMRSFFGDASRPDLLHSAGLREAKVLVVAIDDMPRALEIVKHARRENSSLHIVARARDRADVYRLYQAGATDIVREVFDSSVRAAGYALSATGMHPYDVEKSKNVFVQHDRAGLRQLAPLWREDIPVFDNPEYVAKVKEITGAIEDAMLGKRGAFLDELDRGWTPPTAPAGS